MKYLLILSLFVVGCASTPPAPVKQPEPEPTMCQYTPPKPACSDEIHSLGEEDLKKGFTCPDNTRMTFPSYFQQGRVLVLCQCK